MNLVINLILAAQMLSALAMIGLILIQHGKGADMGAAFGSGSSGSLFGATGGATMTASHVEESTGPKLDEAEDGARAILIEEGVTSWLFGQAQQLNFFEGVKRGGLPLYMLKHVRQFVAGYEADHCPLLLWE